MSIVKYYKDKEVKTINISFCTIYMHMLNIYWLEYMLPPFLLQITPKFYFRHQ